MVAPAGFDAWLVYDFRGSNPVFSRLLGKRFFLTRRAFLLLVPGQPPRVLVSRVDATAELRERSDLVLDRYTSWGDVESWLGTHLEGVARVAMEYSPRGELPAASWVDGGTLELVRETGVEVGSSADLFQVAAAAWGEEGLRSHTVAMEALVAIKDLAFAHVTECLREGRTCTEYDVQQVIVAEFERRGLVAGEPPVVAVNAHSGDPHYAPTESRSDELRAGDWLLVDLWCKERHADAVFADITWVGYLGDSVPEENQRVFDVVAQARDAVVAALRERFAAGETIRGFELDRVARDLIAAAGYGEYFTHRTGHSLSAGEAVHGLGMNLDDLETHDTRSVREGLGFTVEPGIYLPEFGVRLEIDVYMGAEGPVVTAPVQSEPVLLGPV